MEKLVRASGRAFRSARLAGGAIRSVFWCQLFADVLGMPVETTATDEVGALGAMLIAGVGAGLWPSLAEAQQAAVRVRKRFLPADDYNEKYAEFLAVDGR